jgi:hypothetical protein
VASWLIASFEDFTHILMLCSGEKIESFAINLLKFDNADGFFFFFFSLKVYFRVEHERDMNSIFYQLAKDLPNLRILMFLITTTNWVVISE